jgi:glutathione S-transferase
VITLYAHARGRSQRCLLALEEMGLEYQRVSLRPWESDADAERLRRLNPMLKAPVLDDDGLVIFESMAINLYLGDRYGGPLWPANPRDRARLYQWSLWGQTEMDVAARHRARLSGVSERAERAKAERLAALKVVEAALQDRDYLLGPDFTLADVNLATSLTEPWEGGKIEGDLDPAEAGLPAIAAWLSRCAARPAWARVAAME